MDRVQQRGVSGWQNIHVFFVIQMAIVEGPVSKGGTWEEGSVIGQFLDRTKDKRISGR